MRHARCCARHAHPSAPLPTKRALPCCARARCGATRASCCADKTCPRLWPCGEPDFHKQSSTSFFARCSVAFNSIRRSPHRDACSTSSFAASVPVTQLCPAWAWAHCRARWLTACLVSCISTPKWLHSTGAPWLRVMVGVSNVAR